MRERLLKEIDEAIEIIRNNARTLSAEIFFLENKLRRVERKMHDLIKENKKLKSEVENVKRQNIKGN